MKSSIWKICDEVCVKKKSRGGTIGLRGGEKMSRRKQYDKRKWHIKKMCENQSEENKAKHKNIKELAKKVVANSMRKEAEKELTKLNEKPNNVFTLVKFMKKDGKDIEGRRCMRGKDGKLDLREEDTKRI